MSYIKRFFGHLKTILTHKWWVLYYMSNLGFTWRGLVHDNSKFSPTEFFEGVRFWTGKRSPILVAKEQTGISYAWLHHRGRNKHHYEYWIDKLDNGGVPHKMPFKYVVEMVCDWFAACRAYEGNKGNIFRKEYDWWMGKSKDAKIHKDTKKLISIMLWNLTEYQEWSNGNEKRSMKQVVTLLKGWKNLYEDPDIEYATYYNKSSTEL